MWVGHEKIQLQYAFSDDFNDLMELLNLYEPPKIGMVNGNYFHKLLTPTCHIGKCKKSHVVFKYILSTFLCIYKYSL